MSTKKQRAERAAYMRGWMARHPNKGRIHRAAHLSRIFRMTLEGYDSLLKKQGGVCAVCRKPETMRLQGTLCSLSVDHDHSCCSGKHSCGRCIRGLLCSRCNKLVGMLEGSSVALEELKAYLEKVS